MKSIKELLEIGLKEYKLVVVQNERCGLCYIFMKATLNYKITRQENDIIYKYIIDKTKNQEVFFKENGIKTTLRRSSYLWPLMDSTARFKFLEEQIKLQ